MSSDTLQDTVSYLGGVEKAYVRANCWLPMLRKRKETKSARIKYLTLPGKLLTELHDMVGEKIVEGPKDLILVERDLMDYYAILRTAPLLEFKFKLEPFTILNGEMNSLIKNGTLDTLLPVDIVNLDYCGFFWGTDNIASDKWNSVKRLIQLQAHHELDQQPNPFTLLLTVQGRGGATPSIDDTLQEYRNDVGEQWNQISGYKYHGKLLYALPLMLIHVGFSLGYDVRCEHRYVYRPTSVGGTATMLSFGFSFESIVNVSETTSEVKSRAALEQQRCEDVLRSKVVNIVYDRSTQHLMHNEDYDPTAD